MTFDPEKLPPGEILFPTPTYFDEAQFFGRTADVEHVQQLLEAGASVAISGKRRIGRSWFLQHLRTALPQDRYLVVASDELKPDTIVPRQARLFLYALIYALHAALHAHLPANHQCKLLDLDNPPLNVGQTFRNDLAALHQYLSDTQLTAVILLDEAEALYEFTEEAGIVPAMVRSLAASNSYRQIRVVVAGFDLASPIGNQPPLFDAFHHHQLYGVGSDGAYDLIAGQLEKHKVKFEAPEVWARVVLLTGEEPALLRLLGQQLVEQARRNNGLIGTEQIDEAVEDFFAMQQVGSWMSYAWKVLGDNQPIHSLLTALAYNHTHDLAAQKTLIGKLIPQFYSGQPPEAIRGDLRRLCDLGFLRKHDVTGCLQFSSDLMRLWICRNRPDPGI